MVNVCGEYRGKRITLMGLGLLGRGVGDAAFFAECGADVLVTDKKSEAELAESVAALKKYPNIRFRLGGHDEADFTSRDTVVKAAGVRLESPEIAAARAAGVPVVMSTALFAKHAREAGVKIVGITGTRGKSTVTQMIYDGLARAERKAVLGGNVRGVSTLSLLPTLLGDEIAVLELDSWQLQGFHELAMSPDIAIFTTFMRDHLNYYPDMETYFYDKSAIFRYQREGDVFICGAGVREWLTKAQQPVAPVFPPPLPEEWTLLTPGAHNRENASLAAEALRRLGLSESEVREGLESFPGVEGRLQFVREVNGVKIYNDNNATTPEATVAALRALDAGNKNIILIMGGADKGLDMSVLVNEIEQTCKAVVFLSGTGTDSLLFLLKTKNSKLKTLAPHSSLPSAVHAALALAHSGDVLLFSPAFASFGMFKNEYDRNDQFMSFVRSA